jgi:hypothetical protein
MKRKSSIMRTVDKSTDSRLSTLCGDENLYSFTVPNIQMGSISRNMTHVLQIYCSSILLADSL